jgi:hypothetical protein
MHPYSGLCLPLRKLEGQDAADESIKLFEMEKEEYFQLTDLHTRSRMFSKTILREN